MRKKTSTDFINFFSVVLWIKWKTWIVWEKNNPEMEYIGKDLWTLTVKAEELTTVISRTGSRISTHLFPTWTATSRTTIVLNRRSTDVLWRFLIALVAVSRMAWRRAWAVGRWRAGTFFLATRPAILIRFTFSLGIEILPVSMAQFPLLATQF